MNKYAIGIICEYLKIISLIAFVVSLLIYLVKPRVIPDIIMLTIIIVVIMLNMLLYAIDKQVMKDSSEYRNYLLRELEKPILDIEGIDNNIKEESENLQSYKSSQRDIIALMLNNNDEITEYFKISKSQAKASFWFSVISCIVGMAALAVGIYGIVILKDVSISVISLISGSISELISGTVFWVHNKSALQLNHYYDALHENEKFLSAINIADKLSDEKREEMYIEIIRQQIKTHIIK